jgi:RimJ/RimL family protein N-acetyltransferase
MYQLWSDRDVCRYSGEVKNYEGVVLTMPAKTTSVSDQIIDFWERAASDGWGFRWAVSDLVTNVFIGIVGFNSLSTTSEIAYHLLSSAWGKGFMSEAAGAAMQWRLEQGNCHAIDAYIEPDNVKSAALAKRLGLLPQQTFSEGAQLFRRSVSDDAQTA